MSHPDDESQVVRVRPPLVPSEAEVVAGLAGVGPALRRVWPGQPGPRSPWLPCAGGCCLVAEERPGVDPAAWLRFLLRELLAPQAREPRARADRLGLPGGHRVEGRVLLDGDRRPRLLVAVGRRVRVTELDEDPFSPWPAPLEPAPRRGRRRGEVVDLTGRLDTTEQSTRERAARRGRRSHSTER